MLASVYHKLPENFVTRMHPSQELKKKLEGEENSDEEEESTDTRVARAKRGMERQEKYSSCDEREEGSSSGSSSSEEESERSEEDSAPLEPALSGRVHDYLHSLLESRGRPAKVCLYELSSLPVSVPTWGWSFPSSFLLRLSGSAAVGGERPRHVLTQQDGSPPPMKRLMRPTMSTHVRIQIRMHTYGDLCLHVWPKSMDGCGPYRRLESTLYGISFFMCLFVYVHSAGRRAFVSSRLPSPRRFLSCR